MRVTLISFGLALVLAGTAEAQAIDLPRAVSNPKSPAIGNPQLAPEVLTGLLVMTEDGKGNKTIRYIPVNYLNIEALCVALGGSSIDLRSLYYGGRPQSQATARGAAGSLNRNAPLSPFVPAGVRDIVGLQH